MQKILTIVAVLFSISSIAHADGLIDLMDCKKITEDAQRLSCYDKWAENLLTSSPSADDRPQGQNSWARHTEESKMDGVTNVTYATRSTSTLRNSIGRDEEAKLVLRCNQRKTEAFIVWPVYVGSHDMHQVEIKVDNGKIEKSAWSPSTDGTAVFRSKPVNWIKSLAGGKKLIVRLAAYQRIPEEVEFDITGIDGATDEIAKTCGWSSDTKK